MKVLFSADHHIKLNTKNIPVDWARDRFRLLFQKLHELEKTVDMHILGGDFFDKMPTLEELELYYEFVVGCECPTYIISGNHEALKKDTTFLTYLKSITERLNSKVKIIDSFWCLKEAGIDIIPYNRLKEFEKDPREFHGDILVTHVRGEIPPHVKPEVNLEIFSRWKVVLAGDLHSYDNCQRNIIYPGSPITTSFHRQRVSCGVVVLDTDTLEHNRIILELPQLLRQTVKAGDPMPATSPDHTIYEVEGDMEELAKVDNTELLDKKITKRNTEDTALILTPEMSVVQEVTDYLTYILELSDSAVQDTLKVYNDYIKDTNL